MNLSLKFVIALVSAFAAAEAAALPRNESSLSINLARRSGALKMDLDTMSKHSFRARAKYAQAAENYRRNSGKNHPLVSSTMAKRRTGTVDLVDIGSNDLWAGQIDFGTPAQSIYFDFDTGSPDTIANTGSYDPSSSSSSTDTNFRFSLSYGDGDAASGKIYTDTLAIGDISADGIAIGLSDDSFIKDSEKPSQGICGLAYPSISKFPSELPPLIKNLRDQNAIDAGVFQFTLKEEGATLDLGKIDSSRYSGDITWVDYDPSHGFYVADATVNGLSVKTIVDSGTTLIIGNKDEVTKMLNDIEGVEIVPHHDTQIMGKFDCSLSPQVTVNYGGKDFVLGDTQTHYHAEGGCVLPIVGQDGLAFDAWIMGDSFFQMASVIFDQDNQRIGFADQA